MSITQFILICQYLAILALVLELIFIVVQTPSKIQIILLVMGLSSLLMMVGYLVDIRATNPETALTGKYFAYLGKPMLVLTSLLFVLHYSGIQLKKKWTMCLVAYHILLSVIVVTNEYHHLFYSTVAFDRSRLFSPLVVTHGPLYYLFGATMIGYLVFEAFIAAREYHRTNSKQGQRQLLYIFGVIFCAVLGYILYFSGVTQGYDTTMVGCFAATILMGVLFWRYRLFDGLSLAKSQALDDARVAFLVLDTNHHVLYQNNLMTRLLSTDIRLQELVEKEDGHTLLMKNGKVYETDVKSVVDRGQYFGKRIEVGDITESYYYSEQLEQDVESRTRQIKDIQRNILGGFAAMVEARDALTGDHVKKTSAYVEAIAEALKACPGYSEELTEDYIRVLGDVAPLHDIGKLSMPDTILLKNARLSDEEYDVVKKHPENGLKIVNETIRGVENEEYTNMAADVVYAHHEKWDGSGYPQGLKGEEIPLSARIMAVADVYDALRSVRSYKQAFTKEEAKQIILEGKGTHFDPFVVDAFMESLSKIEDL